MESNPKSELSAKAEVNQIWELDGLLLSRILFRDEGVGTLRLIADGNLVNGNYTSQQVQVVNTHRLPSWGRLLGLLVLLVSEQHTFRLQ